MIHKHEGWESKEEKVKQSLGIEKYPPEEVKGSFQEGLWVL